VYVANSALLCMRCRMCGDIIRGSMEKEGFLVSWERQLWGIGFLLDWFIWYVLLILMVVAWWVSAKSIREKIGYQFIR